MSIDAVVQCTPDGVKREMCVCVCAVNGDCCHVINTITRPTHLGCVVVLQNDVDQSTILTISHTTAVIRLRHHVVQSCVWDALELLQEIAQLEECAVQCVCEYE